MKEIKDKKRYSKSSFVIPVIVSLFVLLIAIFAIVVSFIFVEDLELYQALVVGISMLVIVLCTVWTMNCYARYRDSN